MSEIVSGQMGKQRVSVCDWKLDMDVVLRTALWTKVLPKVEKLYSMRRSGMKGRNHGEIMVDLQVHVRIYNTEKRKNKFLSRTSFQMRCG